MENFVVNLWNGIMSYGVAEWMILYFGCGIYNMMLMWDYYKAHQKQIGENVGLLACVASILCGPFMTPALIIDNDFKFGD